MKKALTLTPEKFAKEAIAKFNERITDEIFLFIQNDRILMQKYLRTVEKHTLDKTNQKIGKQIKDLYNFINIGRENSPSSTLI
jgi:hypothetical protein